MFSFCIYFQLFIYEETLVAERRPAQSAVVGSEATRHILIWQAHLNKIE